MGERFILGVEQPDNEWPHGVAVGQRGYYELQLIAGKAGLVIASLILAFGVYT